MLHISNCRFPRKIRILNALCELALSTHVVSGDRNMQSFKLLKFGWLSHVVARSSADVIVAVSVPFVSSTDCGFSHNVFGSFGLHLVCSFKHFFARSRLITGLPAEFKHINKWRTKN